MDKQQNIDENYAPLAWDLVKYHPARISVERLPGDIISGNKVKLAVRREALAEPFRNAVRSIFDKEGFVLDEDYIYTTAKKAQQITDEDFEELERLAKKCYINFFNQPIIDGYIFEEEDDVLNELAAILGASFSKSEFLKTGQLYLTLEEWEKCRELPGLSFRPGIGAIFSIKPSIGYFIMRHYENIDIHVERFHVTVGGELHPDVFQFYHECFGLVKQNYRLVFEFKDAFKLCFQWQQLKEMNIELPMPEENRLIFCLDELLLEKLQSSLHAETLRLKQSLKEYFPDNDFSFQLYTHYTFNAELFNENNVSMLMNESGFWKRMYENFQGKGFSVIRSKRVISFDFETEEELNKTLDYLKSYPFVDVSDHGQEHRFKFYVQLNNHLPALQEKITNKIPDLITEFSASGHELLFRKFYKSGQKMKAINLFARNFRKIFHSKTLHYIINDAFKEKYICKQDAGLEAVSENEKLLKLLNTKFYLEDNGFMYYIGRLYRVHYPCLYFLIEEGRLPEVQMHINEHKAISTIYSNFR